MKHLGADSRAARQRPLTVQSGYKARPALESLVGKPPPPATPAARATAAEVARTDHAGTISQKSLGANSKAQRRPFAVLSGNKAPPALESLIGKPHPPATPAAHAILYGNKARPPLESLIGKPHPPATPAAQATAAEVDKALNGLFLARTNLAGIVSQVDEVISDALKCENMSKRGTQEIESFNGFLRDTEASFKQWSSRLKQALETCPVKVEAISTNTPGTCLNTAAKGNGKLISVSSKLPDTDPVESPCSNFPEADMIVSPSPLVSWHTGSCMVEGGKQLFQLTPLPETKACSSRCTTSKTQMKTASDIDQLKNLLGPVSITPHIEPRSCLKTALSSKQQLFSPIPEGSKKEDIESNGPNSDDKPSGSTDEILKELSSRFDINGINQSTSTRQAEERYDMYGINRYTSTRQAKEPLEWFLSPLKTMVLTEPSSDDNPLPTPAISNMDGKLNVPDDKPIQTPAVYSKALLGTPWKGMESTNLKGRMAGETTLKKELWTRFEAASDNELHFDKARFQKEDKKCLLDMLEEEAS